MRILKVRMKKMLSNARKKEITQTVEKLRAQNPGLSSLAFDIIGNLSEQSFLIGSQPMNDNTTGMLLVDDDECIPNTNTHKLILVNGQLQKEPNFIQRRRFIVAHEYGHYVLHKKDHIQFARRDTEQKDTLEEEEADYFARCLLMPESLVESLLSLDSISGFSLDKKINLVSKLFNVTEKKARERLEKDLCYNG